MTQPKHGKARKPAGKTPVPDSGPAPESGTAKPTVSTRAAPAQQAMTSSQMGIAIEWTERRARGWRQWR
jgi:hypothetical protein